MELIRHHGLEVAIHRIGDAAATAARPGFVDAICLTHATGMCKEVWNPLIDVLHRKWHEAGGRLYVINVDLSGHGGSWQRRKRGRDW